MRLFEVGKKFLPQGGGQGAALSEIETLAGVVVGSRDPEQWGSAREAVDFYDVKADLSAVLALAGDALRVRIQGRCACLSASGTQRTDPSKRHLDRLAGGIASAALTRPEFNELCIFIRARNRCSFRI